MCSFLSWYTVTGSAIQAGVREKPGASISEVSRCDVFVSNVQSSSSSRSCSPTSPRSSEHGLRAWN